jgi:hypothetical protein
MDDPDKRGERDRTHIAVHQDHEAHFWSKELGVSRRELERAVEAVGDSVEAVRRYFRDRRH